jgi:hypothetical protein
VSVCFLETGKPSDATIELVAPTGEDSPVNRILTKDIDAYHLCYEVDISAQRFRPFARAAASW